VTLFNPVVVRQAADWLQWIVLLMSPVILGLALWIARRWPESRRYMWLPMTLAAHSMVFYVMALGDFVPTPWSSLWSVTLRAHGHIIILGALLVVAQVMRKADRQAGGSGDE
jgi:hypothetical protein